MRVGLDSNIGGGMDLLKAKVRLLKISLHVQPCEKVLTWVRTLAMYRSTTTPMLHAEPDAMTLSISTAIGNCN
jgi:hypothetical protein